MGSSDDQAHSPIHPVKNMNKDTLGHEEWRVYDMISRHFLACCSKDAVGDECETLVEIGGEEFKATYLTIREKNFLEIYPFVKWSNSTLEADIPEEFNSVVEIG
jgi:DNA topoisomerase-3